MTKSLWEEWLKPINNFFDPFVDERESVHYRASLNPRVTYVKLYRDLRLRIHLHFFGLRDEDDITRFFKVAKATPYSVLFYEALFTGMRRSELLALRWCHVDLLLCEAHITRSLHHLRTGEIVCRTPKTAKGRRMVSLSPSAALLLQEHRNKQEAQRAMLGIPLKDDDLIFSDLEGKPLLPDTISHIWAKLVKRAGLQEATAARFDEAFGNRYNKREKEAVAKHY